MFPEGTRVEEPDALGARRHGAGRLAIETGAPIVPAAITGTSHLWRGALPKLRRVQIAFLPAVEPAPSAAGHDPASELIDGRVWPAVQEEYGRLSARPGLIAAALAEAGVGGGLLARRRLQASRKPRLLGFSARSILAGCAPTELAGAACHGCAAGGDERGGAPLIKAGVFSGRAHRPGEDDRGGSGGPRPIEV